MNTAKNSSVQKITFALLTILLCWTGSGRAVEATGSPFTYDAGGTFSARAYSGIVGSAQNTLVAYERDVYGTSACAVQGFSVADLDTALYINGIQPLNGTVTFTTAPPQLIDAIEQEGTCSVGPWSAGAIYYQSNAGYSGSDSFELVLVGGDIINVTVTVTAPPASSEDTGGVATITPRLLQTSVRQTASMISTRVRQVIIPRDPFKERLAFTPSPAGGMLSQGSKPAPGSSQTPQQKRKLSDIITVSVNHETIGLSAGDAAMKHGIWTNIAYTASQDDNSITESDMDINTYIMGYDYKLSDRLALGVAVTYEQVDADLDFNNGELDGDGYTVAPYFAMLLTDYLAMDIIAGYAMVNYDQERDFGTVTSSVDADRQFVEFSLNGFHYMNQWSLNGHLTFLYAHEGQGSYRESDGTEIKDNNIDLSQLSAGVEVAYGFKHVEPYLTLAFERDTQYTKINGASYDRSGGDGGLGCRFFFTDQLSGDLYGSSKFSRQNYDEYSVLGNMRYDF